MPWLIDSVFGVVFTRVLKLRHAAQGIQQQQQRAHGAK